MVLSYNRIIKRKGGLFLILSLLFAGCSVEFNEISSSDSEMCDENTDYLSFLPVDCIYDYPDFDPEKLSFDILYEDDDILVVSKGAYKIVNPVKLYKHNPRVELPLNAGDELEVTISEIGSEGDGVIKMGGFILFVPGTKVGDNVRVRVKNVLHTYAFAEVIRDVPVSFEKDTLLNEVASYLKYFDKSKHVGVVRRLAIDTSGIVIFIKTEEAYNNMKSEVRMNETRGDYYALVGGIIEDDVVVNYPLLTEVHEGVSTYTTVEAVKDTDKQKDIIDRGLSLYIAYSSFNPVAVCGNNTLLNVKSWTEVTQQIGAHAKIINHPIVGDYTYGGDTSFLKRHFIHKAYARFIHPLSGKYIEVYSPLSEDLIKTLENYCGDIGTRISNSINEGAV